MAVSIYSDSIWDLHNRFVQDLNAYQLRDYYSCIAALETGAGDPATADIFFQRIAKSLSPQNAMNLKRLRELHIKTRVKHIGEGIEAFPNTVFPDGLSEIIANKADFPEAMLPPPPPRALTTGSQRGLLVLAVVAAVIASIPPFRTVGSLIGRGIAVLSSINNCKLRWSENKIPGNKPIVYIQDNLLKLAKVAAVAAGAIGVAIGIPFLITASLVTDVALQALEFLKSMHRGEGTQAAIHFAHLTVNIVTLIAVTTASWPWMVTAIVINGLAMVTIAILRGVTMKSGEEIIDVICYVALAALGIFNALMIAEYRTKVITQTQFKLKNDTGHNMRVYPNPGNPHLLGNVPDRETITLTLDGEKEHVYCVSDGPQYIGYRSFNSYGGDSYVYGLDEISPALQANLFPTLPVGSTAVEITAPRKVHDFTQI